MDVDKIIGRNLRRIRELQQVSLDDASQQLKMPKQNLSSMETGKRPVSHANLAKFAEFYCVRLTEFFISAEDEHKGVSALLDGEIARMNEAQRAALYAHVLAEQTYRRFEQDSPPLAKLQPAPQRVIGE